MKSELYNIQEYMKAKGEIIENRLDQLVAESNFPYSSLLQAARYSLLSGGKRIRPLLTLATTEMLNGSLENALNPACAIEMIHTYSLIHDDLPCMDDDDFRRGKPSLHKAYPESHAVLAGDFLLTYAFEVIAVTPNLTPQQKIDLIAVLSKNAGASGMIGGQIMDIEAEGKQIDLSFLRKIHEHKTGALISAAIEMGGIIANSSAEEMTTIRLFAREIGLAFQIIDDVLDVTSHKNSDSKNQKVTYVTLLGISEAEKLAHPHYEQALNYLNTLPYDTSLLSSIASLIVNRST